MASGKYVPLKETLANRSDFPFKFSAYFKCSIKAMVRKNYCQLKQTFKNKSSFIKLILLNIIQLATIFITDFAIHIFPCSWASILSITVNGWILTLIATISNTRYNIQIKWQVFNPGLLYRWNTLNGTWEKSSYVHWIPPLHIYCLSKPCVTFSIQIFFSQLHVGVFFFFGKTSQ